MRFQRAARAGRPSRGTGAAAAAGGGAEFVGAGAIYVNSGANIPAPAGSIAGDMLVAVLYHTSAASCAVAGFTERTFTTWAGTTGFSVHTRVATGNGAANDAFHSGATAIAFMVAIRGVTAFNAVAAGVNGGVGYPAPSSEIWSMPQFAPAGGVKYVLAAVGSYRGTAGTPAATAWSDFTELAREVRLTNGAAIQRVLLIGGAASADPTANPTTVSPAYTGGPHGAILSFT